jgi:hypothetical protein
VLWARLCKEFLYVFRHFSKKLFGFTSPVDAWEVDNPRVQALKKNIKKLDFFYINVVHK